MEARWSADGHKIYYRHQGSIMEVDVKPGADFVPSTPKPVMDVSIVGAGGFDRSPAWTVSPDGSRVLGMVEQKSEAPDTINVVLNWQSAMKKLYSTNTSLSRLGRLRVPGFGRPQS